MYLTTSLYKQKKESADLEDKMTEVTKSEGKKKKKNGSEASSELLGGTSSNRPA